ncbi:YbhB/YbcL family Raf kinase inhibitor-like protein [Hypericibacter sp.]|uniref:YbhB/YbcL family Raf kinase inhibitor-like protein n=1 Tax=Hypericibacter sp. TaxID=2705401 RepID=UPI003D6D0A99
MHSIERRLAAMAFALLGGVALLTSPARADEFRLHSSDIVNQMVKQDQVQSSNYGAGCSGGNLSPHLDWENAPQNAQSFVLTVFDKDAPNGMGWFHWVVVNIPNTVNSLPPGASGDGAVEATGAIQTRTDFGTPGYGGPCPPVGTAHRYIFTITALRVSKIPVDQEATPALVSIFIEANKIASASFTAIYAR